ncbi:MAG: hypothetical protein ACOX6S_07225 [Clostridia bacterium]|jgi:hypothetical protein
MNSFFDRMRDKMRRRRYRRVRPIRKVSRYQYRHIRFGKMTLGRLLGDSRFFITASVVFIVVLISLFGPTLSKMMKYWAPKKEASVPQATAPVRTEEPDRIEVKEPIIKDLTAGAIELELKESRINQPVIYGDEILYSAGTGPIDQPVLKSLYLLNLSTKEEKKIADAKVEFGEIYEPLINEEWLVWLDTDQGGTNVIMAMNQDTEETMKIKECKNNKPKLRLSGNTLVWMEQTGDKEDKLYMIDLESGENIVLATFHDEASYGVSAPYIYQDRVFWTGPLPEQTGNEDEDSELSVINILDLKNLSEGIIPELYRPGTYVHEPIGNDRVLVWLDGNKSPDARLLLTMDRKTVKEVAQGVTCYGLGENFLVYGKDQAIWVYFWEEDTYGRLTGEDEKAILPSVQGKTVLWYDITDEESEKDMIKYKVME